MKTKILSKAATSERAQSSTAIDCAASVSIAVHGDARLNLHSPQAALIGRKRVAKSLALEFDDGQSVVLEGFYALAGEGTGPTLAVSTGDVAEILVGGENAASNMAEGSVNGTLVAIPNGQVNTATSDCIAGPEALAAGDAVSAGGGESSFWTTIAPFVPLFAATAGVLGMKSLTSSENSQDSGAPVSTDGPAVSITAVSDDAAPVIGTILDGGETNDISPTLSGLITGTLAPGDVIAIYRDNVRVGTATVSGNSWNFTDAGLSVGAHTYQARVEALGGKQGGVSEIFSITLVAANPGGDGGSPEVSFVSIIGVNDDVAPVTGKVTSGGATNDTSPAVSGSFTGSLAGGEVIAVYRDNTRVGTATLSGNSWSFTDTGLSDGAHSYQARVEDTAGNARSLSDVYAIIVDTRASGTPGANDGVYVSISAVNDDAAPVIGPVPNGGSTNDTSPTLSGGLTGTLDSGEVIAIYRDNIRIGTASLSGSNWSFTDSGLADGSYNYQARIVDLAGNQGAASTVYGITVDTHASGAPGSNDGVTVSISTVIDDVAPITGTVIKGGVTNDTAPTLNGAVTGTLASGEVIAIYRDNVRIGTASVSGGNWSFTDRGLMDGSYSYQARIEDLAGNQGAASSVHGITVDTHASGAPGSNDGVLVSITAVNDDLAPSTGPVARNGVTDDSTPTLIGSLTGTLATGEVIAIYRDDIRIGTALPLKGNWSFTDNGLANGPHTYLARIEDLAGNQGASSSAYTIIVESSAPAAVAITAISDDSGASAADFITSDTLLTVSGTNATLSADSRIQVSSDNGATWAYAEVTGNTWRYADPATHAADFTYMARVVDIAGNVGHIASQDVTIDTHASGESDGVALSIVSITDNAGAVTGTLASGASTDDTSPALNGTLTGTLAAGEVIAIYRDDTRIGTASLSGGNWSFTDASLADGAHTYLARVEDVAGNQGAASNAYAITVDTSGTGNNPSSSLAITRITDDTGTSAGDFITSDTTLSVSGTNAVLGAGSKIQLSSDGVTWADVTDRNSATTWNFDDTATAHTGDFTYSVRVLDAAGTVILSDSQAVTIDTTAPGASETVAITAITTDTGSLDTDFITADTVLEVSGTNATLSADSRIQVSSDEGATWAFAEVTGNTWRYADPATHAADFTYMARVVDTAGNVGQTASQGVTIDTSASGAPGAGDDVSVSIDAITDDAGAVTGTLASGASTDDTTPALNGTLIGALAEGEVIVIYRDDIRIGTASLSGGSWSFTDAGLLDGDHAYQARIEDIAGNQGAASNVYDITVDTSGLAGQPLAITRITDDTGTSAFDFITSDTTLSVSGTNPALAGGKVQVSSNDGATWADAVVTGSTWSYTDPVAHAGDFIYTVRVLDAAGTAGQSVNQAVTIDTTAPGASETVAITALITDTGLSDTDFITRDTILEVTGTNATLSADSRIQVSSNGGATWAFAEVMGNTWRYADPATHQAGFTYMARVVDTAGNVGHTDSKSVTIDTTAPEASETVAITAISDDSGASAADFITSDTLLTVSGTNATLSADSRIQVSSDNGATWAYAEVTGNTWRYADPATHAADFTYMARVVDIAGNVGHIASQDVTIDTHASGESDGVALSIVSITDNAGAVTGTLASGASTDDTSPALNGTLTGTLAAGEVIAIYRDDTRIGTASLSGGNWSFTDASLADGAHTYLARVEDVAGNQGAASNAYAITVDTSGTGNNPSSSLAITRITDDTGTSAGDFITSDTTLSVSGTNAVLGAGSKIQLSSDGTTWADVNQTSATTWSFDDTATVHTGDFTYSVRVLDASGNLVLSTSQDVTIDTTAPDASETVAITAISTDTGSSATDFVTSDTTLSVSGTNTALSAGNTIQVSSDGTTWVNVNQSSATTWNFDDTANPHNSSFTYSVRVVDAAGNVGQSDNRNVTIDTTAPSASETVAITAISTDSGASASDFITSDTTLSVSGTNTALSAGNTIQVSSDGTTWVNVNQSSATTWSFDDTANPHNSSFTYSVRVVDAAGNVGQTNTQAVTIDTRASGAPGSNDGVTVAITAVFDDQAPGVGNVANGGIANDTTPTLSGSFTGTLAADEVIAIYRDGVQIGAADRSGGNWTYADSGLVDGSHSYLARVEDLAGNVGATSNVHAITVNTSGAGQSLVVTAISTDTGTSASDFITSDTTLIVSGINAALSVGNKIQLSSDGTTWADVNQTSATTWSFDDTATVHTGDFTYSVRVLDASGNLVLSTSQDVTIDTTAPDASETVAITAISTDTGSSATDFVTSDTTLIVSGTHAARSGNRIQVSIDGGVTWSNATLTDTTWSYADPVTHTGDFTYAVRVVDVAGNVGQTTSQNVTIDTTPPSPSETVAITAISTDSGTSASDFITNDTTLIVSGINAALSAGNKIQITSNGTTWTDVTQLSATAWVYDDTQNVHTSTFAYNVRVVDTAGNVGQTASRTVTIDTQASGAPGANDGVTLSITGVTDDVTPITGPVATGGSTNDNSPTLSGSFTGTLESGEVIAIYRDNTRIGTAGVSGSSWNFADSGLTDGSHTYQACVEDLAGNQGAASGVYAITVDITSPSATETAAITAISTDTGASATDFITSDTTLIVSGTNTALSTGNKIQVSSNGVTWTDVTQSSATTWTFDDTANPHTSSFTYSVRVVDAAGNAGPVVTRAVTIDTTVTETAAITAISTDTGASTTDFITSDTTLTVSGTNVALPAGSSVQVSSNGGTTWANATVSGTTWSYLDPLAHATSFTYSVRVIDTAGNAGPVATRAVTIDTTAPTETAAITAISTDTGASATDFITSDTTLTVSGTNVALPAGSSVQVSSNGGTTWANATVSGTTWSYLDPLAHATSFTYSVRVIDTAGNAGPVATRAVTIDTTAPTETAAITAISTDTGASATDFITSDTTLTVSGTNVALPAGSSVQVSSNGGTTWANATVSGTTWSYLDPLAHATSFTYSVRVIDTAGNAGPVATRAVTIDTTAPTETAAITAISTDTGASATDFITSDTTLTVSGTNVALPAGSSVQVSSNGGTTWANAAVSGTSWSYLDPLAHATSFTYSVRVVDAAGNIGSIATRAVTIDTTAPLQPTIARTQGDLVTGTAEANSVVRVTVNGTLTGTATANGLGQWTFDLIPDAVHGAVIGAQAQDAAGNLSTQATTTADRLATITIDGTLMGDNIFNTNEANAVLVTGTTLDVEAGRVVQLTLTDSAAKVFQATATVGSDGRWSASNLNLVGASYGLVGITAAVSDQLGNAAAANTNTLRYILPVDILAIDEDLGISTNDFLTSDSEPAVRGTADRSGTVTLTGSVKYWGDTGVVDLNGDPVFGVLTYNLNQVVTVAADGTWRSQLLFGAEMGDLAGLPIPLLDTTGGQAPYTLTATWTRAGTSSFSDAASVSIDTVAPDLLTLTVGPTYERQVNTFVANDQVSSRVVGLADGGYVIVWTSESQDSTSSTDVGLYGQRYDASGNRINGEFRINTTLAGNQGRLNNVDWEAMFDLVADPITGGFTVVWTSVQKGGSYDVNTPTVAGTGGFRNIVGQRYDANGVPITTDIDGGGIGYAATNEFIVNSAWDSTTTNALLPRVINLENGNFAVVWASNANATTGMGYDMRAQLFNASWQRIGGEIAVTNERYNQGYWPESDGTATNVDIDNLAVTAKSGGGFMVSWSGTDPSLSSSSLSNANIYSATFNSAGVPVGSRTQVNTGVTNNQIAPVSTTLNDGSTVVVWISNQATDYDIYSQRYDTAGNRIGVETRVNAALGGHQGTLGDIQKELGVTALSNGGYVVVWAGKGSASTTEPNIYMRVYSAAGTALSSQDTVINQGIKGIQMMPHVAALDGGGFIVTWSSQYGGTDQGSDYAVMQRAYHNDGTLRPLALDTPELLVNAGATTNSQYGTSLSASSVNRNVAVSWIERGSTAGYGATGTTETTKAAVFDFGGRKIADLQVANIAGADGSYSGEAGKAAQILALSNGNYVLVREAQNGTTAGDVWASIYGPNGAVVKADFLATSSNALEQNGPAGLVELKDATGASTGQWVMLYIGRAGTRMQPQLGIFKANGDDALLDPDVVVSSHGATSATGQGLISTGAWESTAHMASSNGRFAVVWSDAWGDSANSGGDQSLDAVYMRIFSNDGKPLGLDFKVNIETTNNQSAPKIAALSDGSFLVTWVDSHVSATTYDVYMQRFAADGTRLSSADQLVTGGFTSGNQGVYGTLNAERAQQHDVVALVGGGWVVSYVDNSTGTRNVLANIYDAAGNLMTSKLQLASVFSGTEEYYPTLAALSNGGFVASWTSTNKVLGDTSGTGAYMRYFDESGNVRSFSEFEAGGSAIVIEPGMLVGGSTNADAYNLDRKAADPTFDIPTDGMSANYDAPSTLWKAEVNILNYQQGDVLGWDAAKAAAAGITATYDGAGHLVMLFGAATTINGIEALLRSVTYSGGATPVAGDRAIEFALIDKAGSTTTQESGITVESPALGLTGTAGNDVLTGANGNDGIFAMGGIDTVSAGNGDDRIYVSNPALSGQYQGGQGFDTLVLDFTGTQSVNLSALVGHAYGIERLDLGNTSFAANSTSLRIDNLSNVTSIVDAGVTHLLVQGSSTDSVTLANSLNLTKVAVTSQDYVYFDIYQAAGNDIQLWLQQGMAVTQV